MPASRRGGGGGGADALRSPGRRPPPASPKSPWPSLGLSQSITQQVLHQGAARVATLARRWLRRVQVAAPLAVTSRTQPCGPERLLHINLSNELAAELSVSSIHLQCVPGGGGEAGGERRAGRGGGNATSYDPRGPTGAAANYNPMESTHSWWRGVRGPTGAVGMTPWIRDTRMRNQRQPSKSSWRYSAKIRNKPASSSASGEGPLVPAAANRSRVRVEMR